MIKITLPDGTIKEFEKNSTPMDVAKSISEGLARNVISARFNEDTVETKTPLSSDGTLTLFTWNNPEGKKAFWHSQNLSCVLSKTGMMARLICVCWLLVAAWVRQN